METEKNKSKVNDKESRQYVHGHYDPSTKDSEATTESLKLGDVQETCLREKK